MPANKYELKAFGSYTTMPMSPLWFPFRNTLASGKSIVAAFGGFFLLQQKFVTNYLSGVAKPLG